MNVKPTDSCATLSDDEIKTAGKIWFSQQDAQFHRGGNVLTAEVIMSISNCVKSTEYGQKKSRLPISVSMNEMRRWQ
jgi:hypothetical protein